MKPSSWTAVRKGKIYCAPACGGNCTWAAFQKATRKAADLCKILGPEWLPRIYENMGWHFEALHKSGIMSVSHAHLEGRIWICCMSASRMSPGARWTSTALDPRHAVEFCKRNAQHELNQIKAAIAALDCDTTITSGKPHLNCKRAECRRLGFHTVRCPNRKEVA